jgi:hypothetical protein
MMAGEDGPQNIFEEFVALQRGQIELIGMLALASNKGSRSRSAEAPR